MNTRRQSRETALQILYQIEMSGGDFPKEEIFKDEKVDGFAKELIEGVLARKGEIDQCITGVATHWKLERMPAVDRNLLRLAVFELKACPDIPLKVVLNEAIEIAKKFGGQESGTFINGVLDTVAKDLRKE